MTQRTLGNGAGVSSAASKPHGWATCLTCGYKHKGYVREVKDELLDRCPSCTAYNWSPKPIKVAAS